PTSCASASTPTTSPSLYNGPLGPSSAGFTPARAIHFTSVRLSGPSSPDSALIDHTSRIVITSACGGGGVTPLGSSPASSSPRLRAPALREPREGPDANRLERCQRARPGENRPRIARERVARGRRIPACASRGSRAGGFLLRCLLCLLLLP